MSNASRPPTREARNRSPLFVKSLEKALRVLESFRRAETFQGLSQVAENSRLDKSTAQRLTHTLRQLGYLEQCPSSRRYRLGRKVLDLSFNYLRNDPLVERATPLLIDLVRDSGERVDLSLFDDVEILYVARFQSKRQTFSTTLIGRRMPTFCTSGGRAMLAYLDDIKVEDIFARSRLAPITEYTITDPKQLMERVWLARRRGYAVNVQECLPGEMVVSAAVTDEHNYPLGAVHIAGSLSEWSVGAFERKMAPKAVAAAESLSRP
jgi:IclR family transcriptional regulator, pca regulon regulatory protein